MAENPATLHSIDTDLSTKGNDKEAKEDPRQGLPSTVKVEEGAPFIQDNTKRVASDGKYIKYNGVGTVRIMGPAEWRAVNIDCDDYFEWNGLNKKRIPLEAFTDEQLQYLLRVDGRFELVELEATKDVEPSKEKSK